MKGPLALLALLGFAVAIPILDSGDKSDTSPTDPDDPDTPDPEVDGENLVFDGSDTLTGGAGDDTLTALPDTQDYDLQPTVVDLGAGDDEATIDVQWDFLDISGGEGDDMIVTGSDVLGSTLDGGEGNDTLVSGTSNQLLGGAGDDEITIDLSGDVNDSFVVSDAGEGDDTITIASDVGNDVPDFSSAGVIGGEGNDAFIAEMTVVEDQYELSGDEDSIRSFSGISFHGFDPAEDTLLIELDRDEGQEDRMLINTELVPQANEGEYQIRFTFGATDDDPEMTTYVTLRDVEGPISLEDIDIVDLVSAA